MLIIAWKLSKRKPPYGKYQANKLEMALNMEISISPGRSIFHLKRSHTVCVIGRGSP